MAEVKLDVDLGVDRKDEGKWVKMMKLMDEAAVNYEVSWREAAAMVWQRYERHKDGGGRLRMDFQIVGQGFLPIWLKNIKNIEAE